MSNFIDTFFIYYFITKNIFIKQYLFYSHLKQLSLWRYWVLQIALLFHISIIWVISIFQIKKPQEYFWERATHWLTPRLPINVNYFYQTGENHNFVSLAAPLSAHSTHSLKRKGFFRRVPAWAVLSKWANHVSVFAFPINSASWFFARSVFVMTVNLSSVNSCAKRIYTNRKHCSNVLKPKGRNTQLRRLHLIKWYYVRKKK